DGLIVIDKPPGLTSHDVVFWVRKLIKDEKTGHCGTLDPDATGVLLVTVGKATRLFPFLSGHEKTYRGTIRFGFSTDTYDASGRPTSPENPVCPEENEIRGAMRKLEGKIFQTPPPFSAKKLGGQPSYKLARAEKDVILKAQEVTVRRFELEAFRPPLADFTAECSSGTYVRALAHDLGRLLGCGAHLADLRRTVSGDFGLADAHSLDEVRSRAEAGDLKRLVVPIEDLLPRLQAIMLETEGEERARHGNRILPNHVLALPDGWPHASPGQDSVFRLIARDGRLLALARLSQDREGLSPFLVLSD
ncbi:tRNA pseudouridine(55) synthase TruB, partial [bacterium]